MPVMRGKDKDGAFYRWGSHGTKYRYTPGDAESRDAAKAKAARQGTAIHARVMKDMAKVYVKALAPGLLHQSGGSGE